MPVALELLAPAKNKGIGIAAIDCGADAVYIAGPSFGAREAAGNSFDDIAELTGYAHKFGAKVFLTLNTLIYEQELEAARQTAFQAAEAGCDALIVQDLGLLRMSIPQIELHASTQCNIRTVEQARWLASLGFKRCVSYSGQCYLSQYLTGRSANRGCCIQACRSRYDVKDAGGKTILRDKAILSLKDLCLLDRVEQLAEAGATSFKIEGRLKNISYVSNIVRTYSDTLDRIVQESGGKYVRSSYGTPTGGFTPHPEATFNRGYTHYFIDGKRDNWCSGNYAKGIGEPVGTIVWIKPRTAGAYFEIAPREDISTPLTNGDGLCFISRSGSVQGLRADTVQNGIRIFSSVPQEVSAMLRIGMKVYRSYNQEFERSISRGRPIRLIPASTALSKDGDGWTLSVLTVNGISAERHFRAETASNREKAESGLKASLSRKSGLFAFTLTELPEEGPLPFLPSSAANALRRELAAELESLLYDRIDAVYDEADMTESVPWERIDHSRLVPPKQTTQLNCANSLSKEVYAAVGIDAAPAYELDASRHIEFMRCKYCIRYEMRLCPRQPGNGVRKAAPLYLVNNDRHILVTFNCSSCEMILKSADP